MLGAESRVYKLNKAFAELGRNAAVKSNNCVIVAGSIGHTEDVSHPIGELTHETAVEMFHEQAEELKETSVDILWIETIPAAQEFAAAAGAFE